MAINSPKIIRFQLIKNRNILYKRSIRIKIYTNRYIPFWLWDDKKSGNADDVTFSNRCFWPYVSINDIIRMLRENWTTNGHYFFKEKDVFEIWPNINQTLTFHQIKSGNECYYRVIRPKTQLYCVSYDTHARLSFGDLFCPDLNHDINLA